MVTGPHPPYVLIERSGAKGLSAVNEMETFFFEALAYDLGMFPGHVRESLVDHSLKQSGILVDPDTIWEKNKCNESKEPQGHC